MTHDEAIHLLSARIDGPLPAPQQEELDRWLAESADHAILAEAFQTQHGELRTAFEPRRGAARATATAVAQQLAGPVTPSEGLHSRRWWRFLASPLPAACAAAIVLAGSLRVAADHDRIRFVQHDKVVAFNPATGQGAQTGTVTGDLTGVSIVNFQFTITTFPDFTFNNRAGITDLNGDQVIFKNVGTGKFVVPGLVDPTLAPGTRRQTRRGREGTAH